MLSTLQTIFNLQKACHVRAVRTTDGEYEQIMRGRRRREQSPVQSLIANLSLAWVERAERMPIDHGVRRNDLRDAPSNSCLIIPSRLTIRDRLIFGTFELAIRSEYAKKLVQK